MDQHVSALIPDAIEVIHADMDAKAKENYVDVVYLDEVEHLLGTEEWR